MKQLTDSVRAALMTGLLLLVGVPLLHAQTTIDSTTLSASITSETQSPISIASVTCTGCTFGKDVVIYIDNEAMCVTQAYASPPYNGAGTLVPVQRGCMGTKAATHTIKNQANSGNTVVFVAPNNRYHQGVGGGAGAGSGDPAGSCLRVNQPFLPWINISNGWVWTCDNTYWRATVNLNINGTAASRTVN